MTLHAPNPTELAALQSKLFKTSCELSDKAQATHDLDDGIAAGRAYKAFIDSFLTESQIAVLKGDCP